MDRVAAVLPSVGDVDPAGWLDCFDDMFARVVAPAFGRREPRLRAEAYLLGLVAGLERANGWTIAEFAGDRTPLGMQRLLNQAVWDQDGVRDRLVRYVAAELGDLGGVLIADETGFEKSGKLSVILSFEVDHGCDLGFRVADDDLDVAVTGPWGSVCGG
jgi:hypothetical protein